MAKTVGSIDHITSVEVQPESIWQALRWIHFDQPQADFDSLLADMQPRLLAQTCLPPLELVQGYKRVAAAYFIQLKGRVATLGGIRSLAGYEQTAARLLQEFTSRLEALQVQQIQALVDVSQVQTALMMSNSVFHQVTTIKHLWFDPCQRTVPNVYKLPALNWRSASSLSTSAFCELLEATFQNTLDCPALNGLRSGEDVLYSFLDDHVWNIRLPWLVLYDGVRPIGCSLINRHPRQINELVYVGLIDSYRGQGLGRLLVQSAMAASRIYGADMLVTAVDSQNWPAYNIYRNLGFIEHRELAVWLPSRTKKQALVAA